jgi:hypothetical protein
MVSDAVESPTIPASALAAPQLPTDGSQPIEFTPPQGPRPQVRALASLSGGAPVFAIASTPKSVVAFTR